MGTLTLNDGTVLQNSYALLSAGILFLYIQQAGITLAEVFNLLIDPENTSVIVYTQVNGDEVTYERYEKLRAVRDEGDGLFTAVLERMAI